MLDTDEERTCFSGIYEKYKRLVYYSAWQVLHDDGLWRISFRKSFCMLPEIIRNFL